MDLGFNFVLYKNLVNLNEGKFYDSIKYYKKFEQSPKYFHKVYGVTRFLEESVSLSKVYLVYLKKVVKGDETMKKMKTGTRLKDCGKIN